MASRRSGTGRGARRPCAVQPHTRVRGPASPGSAADAVRTLCRARRPMPYRPSAVRPACKERGPWKVSIRPIWELVRDAKPQAQRFAHRIGACVLTRSKRFPRKNSGLLILHYAVKLKKKKRKKKPDKIKQGWSLKFIQFRLVILVFFFFF